METDLRILMAIGFTGLLVILRLDAELFGAADFDEPGPSGLPSLRRRFGWYFLGMALVAAISIVHPDPERELNLALGDRAAALLGGLAYGALGTGQAAGIAWLRYRHLRLPSPVAYPGAVVNAIATAFVDEAAFRGALLGFVVLAGIDGSTAIVIQALVYALATRLGARGRDPYGVLLALGMGLVGGWLTLATGGIGAAFLGHAITRIAVFVCTGHAGRMVPVSGDPIEQERRRRMPEGWSVVGAAERGGRDR